MRISEGGGAVLYHRSRIVLVVLVGLAVLLPWLALAIGTLQAGRSVLVPEIERRIETVGRGAVQRTEHALALGIPLDKLNGVARFFEGIFVHTPDIGWIALTDPSGVVVHVAAAPGREGSAPAIGQRVAPGGGQPLVTLPVRHGETEAAVLVLQWSVVGDGALMASSLAALALILLAGLVAAWEVARCLWGVGAEANGQAVERVVRQVLKGDLTVATAPGEQGVLGRLGDDLTRLIRRVNYRSEELEALARDVARTLPKEDARRVIEMAAAPVAGLRLAPEEADVVAPPRQMALARFVMFCVGVAFALPVLLLLGGLPAGLPPTAWLWTAMATLLPAVLLSRFGILARVPGRLLAAIGAAAMVAALLGVLAPWPTAGLFNGLLLGVGLGCLLQPVLLGSVAEGRSLEEVAQQTLAGLLAGLVVGTGLGAVLLSLLPQAPVGGLSGLMIAPALGAVLLWHAPPGRLGRISDGVWPNLQEIAAVAARGRLALLTLLVAVPSRLLPVLVLVLLAPRVLLGLEQGLVDLAWVVMTLPVCLALGWLAAATVGGGVRPYLLSAAAAVLTALLAPLVAPEWPVVALLTLAVLMVAAGAAANARRRAAKDAAEVAGHGIGHGRFERVVSFFEGLALAGGLGLAALGHGVGATGLVQAVAVVAVVGCGAAALAFGGRSRAAASAAAVGWTLEGRS